MPQARTSITYRVRHMWDDEANLAPLVDGVCLITISRCTVAMVAQGCAWLTFPRRPPTIVH